MKSLTLLISMVLQKVMFFRKPAIGKMSVCNVDIQVCYVTAPADILCAPFVLRTDQYRIINITVWVFTCA